MYDCRPPEKENDHIPPIILIGCYSSEAPEISKEALMVYNRHIQVRNISACWSIITKAYDKVRRDKIPPFVQNVAIDIGLSLSLIIYTCKKT